MARNLISVEDALSSLKSLQRADDTEVDEQITELAQNNVYAQGVRVIANNLENTKDAVAEKFNKFNDYDYVKMSYDEDTGEYTQTGMSAEDYEAEIANGGDESSVYMTSAGYANTCLKSMIRNSVSVIQGVAEGNMTLEAASEYDFAGAMSNEALYNEAALWETKESGDTYLMAEDSQVDAIYDVAKNYLEIPDEYEESESAYKAYDRAGFITAAITVGKCYADQEETVEPDELESYDYIKLTYDEENDCYSMEGSDSARLGVEDGSFFISQDGYQAAKNVAMTADFLKVTNGLMTGEMTAEDAANYDYNATGCEIYNIAANCMNNGVDLLQHDVEMSDITRCLAWDYVNSVSEEELLETRMDLDSSRFDMTLQAMESFGCIESEYEKDDEFVTGDLSEYAPF